MDSILDMTTRQAAVVEANAIAASRTRGWDEISRVTLTSQVNFLNTPNVLTAQGIRMLNGTPGQFANAVPAGA
jgi:hypothetical protein